ncbi:MAG: hypothetical protein CL832_03720 [Crocinitomicaceae bacterium]|mgnify:CR=1 FL=1|nr:hypothetical protein [Crocinitomicaceae bacterium]|tara:strand:- start:2507 stop:2794 length:288 start_codon:yes stop_codon:yes gene_type:complete
MKRSEETRTMTDVVFELEQLQKKLKEEINSLQSDKGLIQNDLEHYNKQLLITENNLKVKKEYFELLEGSIGCLNGQIFNKKYSERYKAKQRFENN